MLALAVLDRFRLSMSTPAMEGLTLASHLIANLGGWPVGRMDPRHCTRKTEAHTVPADPAIQLDHLGEVRDALGAIQATHDEYADFFSGVFTRLESMSDAVTARDRQIEELQQQRQLWEQERSALERELEAVRDRAAEMNEAIVQQKRDAELRHNEWSGELKRMRKALQQMAHRLVRCNEEAAEPPSAVANSRSFGSGLNASSDPVLDSVMAQFEVLRKDVARRNETRRS